MKKYIKVWTAIAIVLFPSASFADTIAQTRQEVNLESHVNGNGRVKVTHSHQSTIDTPPIDRPVTNVGNSSQTINMETTTGGNHQTSIKLKKQLNKRSLVKKISGMRSRVKYKLR